MDALRRLAALFQAPKKPAPPVSAPTPSRSPSHVPAALAAAFFSTARPIQFLRAPYHPPISFGHHLKKDSPTLCRPPSPASSATAHNGRSPLLLSATRSSTSSSSTLAVPQPATPLPPCSLLPDAPFAALHMHGGHSGSARHSVGGFETLRLGARLGLAV